MSDYYAVSGNPSTGAAADSATMRAEFALISAGFDKLPDLTVVGNRVPHVNSGSTAIVTTSGFTFDGTTLTAPTIVASTNLNPDANDGAGIGTSSLGWSDLYLASGALIDFANGNAVLTHSSGILTVSTGDLRITTAGTNAASAVTVGGTQTLTAKTLTSPTITTSPTAVGATWTDLGAVTTADINGGTIDGVTIGGTSAGAGTFTTGSFSSTVTLSGTAANIALGSNFISNGGTDAGLSLDASNNATLSGTLTVSGATGENTFATSVRVSAGKITNATTANAGFRTSDLSQTNYWDIYRDNSVSGDLKIDLNGANKLILGTTSLTLPGGTITTGSTTALSLATTAQTWVTITNGGLVGINDTSNANMTTGLTINQGAADNEILAFKSSDIAHGITDYSETDTFGTFSKALGSAGGMVVTGYVGGSAAIALALVGYGSTDETTKSVAGTGYCYLTAAKKNGTGLTAAGANANLLVVANNSSARFILDADGDSHQDVGTAWTNFDAHNDLMVMDAMAVALNRGDVLRSSFIQSFEDARNALAQIPGKPIVTFNEDGHHFANMSRVTMLHHGAIRQLGERVKADDLYYRGQLEAHDNSIESLLAWKSKAEAALAEKGITV